MSSSILNKQFIHIYFSNAVFRDIAESLEYVFVNKGISCNLTHKLDDNNKNLWIILGANELPPSTLLPPNYIIYQLEQIYLKNNKWLTDKYIELMRKAKGVWDYSRKNIFVLQSHNIKAQYVPISYTPTLTKTSSRKEEEEIEKEKDIDFLFIGSLNQRRLDILETLQKKNYKVMVADGSIWGDERIDLLKRSKCLLNIHYYCEESPLEMARVSLLLANRCFVISEIGGDNNLEKDLHKGIIFCYYKDIIKNCEKYISDTYIDKRISVANKGFEIFSKLTYNIPSSTFKLIKDYSVFIPKEVDFSKQNKDKGLEIKPVSDKDKIDKIQLLIDSDGYSSIKVPPITGEYPTVSLITPTKNRKIFISLMIHQVEKLDYPKDKLEWIIVDDSNDLEDSSLREESPAIPSSAGNFEDSEYIKETLKNLCKIKYNYIHISKDNSKDNTISYKRNFAIKQSNGEYICHIDDDDFYFPHSLKTKIAFLENMKNKNCIGSTELPVYNLLDDTSILTNSNNLAEASMVYRRTFWETREFSEHLQGEGYAFTINRRNELLDIPYLFSMIAVNHGNNVTGKTRLYTGNSNNYNGSNKSSSNSSSSGIITNLLEAMDEETQDILLSIKNYKRQVKVIE